MGHEAGTLPAMTSHFDRFKSELFASPELGLWLDTSRIQFASGFHQTMEPRIQGAYKAMEALEKGAVANPDEKRMVGHYWLRAPELAPPGIGEVVTKTLKAMLEFSQKVHEGAIKPEKAAKFSNVLVVGIGGSALGPQFVAQALGQANDKMRPFFFDNTDPDGMDRVLARIGAGIGETLTVVISKSGGTKETRNGMLEAEVAYKKAGLSFAKHAVAVTGEGSELDKWAIDKGFIARFPMWDWVGGRTSELSAVGLLPAALQGLDIEGMLGGAKDMDVVTRIWDTGRNPAARLALAWHSATGGIGKKDMVLLPYKDRLELFSKYLQQLLMESLGKAHDLDGKPTAQGIAVYGNKGSTDQHAYVQQLRDGLNNFFVTFIEVLRDRAPGNPEFEVEPGVTSGDYLSGFFQGTRKALTDSGRESITITINEVSPRTVGMLIALYERAVGFYATLVNINAYHQPGVEAGKKAAADVLAIQHKVVSVLGATPRSLEEVASAAGVTDVETVFFVLRHLAANPSKKIKISGGEKSPFEAKYTKG